MSEWREHHYNPTMATATTTETTAASGLQHAAVASRAEHVGTIEDAIQTEITYLVKDPKHEHEKPYDIRYDTGGAIPSTNMENETRSVTIHNFRAFENSQSFKDYGFSSAKINCALTAAEFDDEKRVEEVYYPMVEKFIRTSFPDAVEVRILEHHVRTQWVIMLGAHSDLVASFEKGMRNFLHWENRSLNSLSLLHTFT
jgi:hypothetical protein